MTLSRVSLAILVTVLTAASLIASGPAGIYALIDKVVFEPSEQSFERIQIWGTFSFYHSRPDRMLRSDDSLKPQRGYLYFALPRGSTRGAARLDWMDLKTVAGTGTVVAFGKWVAVGNIEDLQPRSASGGVPYFIPSEPGSGHTYIWLRKVYDAKAEPAIYSPNVGVTKLSNTGWEIVKRLKEAP